MNESAALARIVPKVPGAKDRIKLLVDTDAANEVDDLYAVALAIASQDRFDIKGFVASHFAARAGPESIGQSYDVLVELFGVAGVDGQFALKRGSHPMRYPRVGEPSEGVDLIIECANQCTVEDPLWVVCLGAATDLASALLLAPEITDRVRFLYHGRSEVTWPHRTEQFNVYGDIIATQTLLESRVPLLWFDTGTHLVADMATTAKRLAPIGRIGQYLHEYRRRSAWMEAPDKGFFDVGDIAWLIDPQLCRVQEIDAPEMTRWMVFRQTNRFGRILHLGNLNVDATWDCFYSRMQLHFGADK